MMGLSSSSYATSPPFTGTSYYSTIINTLLPAILLLLMSIIPGTSAVAPTVMGFQMDMSYGLITIEYSTVMVSKTFDWSTVSIQNVPSYYNCTGTSLNGTACPITDGAKRQEISGNNYYKVYNATSLYISILIDDYADFASTTGIGKRENNTYLVIEPNSARSAASMEYSEGISNTSALL